MDKQTRIFVPDNSMFNQEDWAENLLGLIIKPITIKFKNLNWFWFSRYWGGLGNENEDCNTSEITDQWKRSTTQYFYSLRFRYSINNEECFSFEQELQKLISKFGCKITDFRNYDKISDLGSDRHLGGERTPERKSTRADIITDIYHSVSKLTLDTLEGPNQDGRFKIEMNDSNELPEPKSSFYIPHHLFCNITNMPLHANVRVFLDGFYPADIYGIFSLPIRY